MGYLIGADIGSQSVKVILLDPDGTELGSAGQTCTMTHPASGWAETDPLRWQTALAGADRIFATTGLVADASHIAPKLMWLRDHEPEVYREAACFPPVGGYLLGWLTGTIAQDHANASSTLLYDLRTGTWDEVMLEAAGLDADRLAPVRPSAQVAGRLAGGAASALGLTSRCSVVVGTGDEHSACIGAGAIVPGLVADVTGTAEPVAVTAREPVFDPDRVVETYAHAVTGMLLVENPGFVSGGCTLWCAESVVRTDQAGMFMLAGTAPPGSGGALFLPAISGATAPRWNDRMRGAFAGLAMNHDRSHLARAVLEGCGYALRDVLGRMEAPEPTAAGAAVLAGLAAGAFGNVAQGVARTVRLAPRSFRPNPANTGVYAERYAQYRALYDGIEGALT